jgi:hypothetical protein
MTVTVSRDRSHKAKHTMQVRQHSFAVDEPRTGCSVMKARRSC